MKKFAVTSVTIQVICCLILTSCQSEQQQNTASTYPEPLPDTTALTFLPGIVSGDTLDFNATFSPDGKTFYFSRSLNRKYVIMESRYDAGRWNQPVISAVFDTAYSNTDPFIAADHSMYFISNRLTGAGDTIPDFDIYRMVWNGNKWNAAERLGEINSDSTEYYVSVANNGNIYFASYRDGNLDLYMAKKDGDHYHKPVNLGGVVNSSSDEHDPLIAPDERYLVFTSSRPGGSGEADLYISYNKNGEWQRPVNMGSRINTATYEYCPNLTPDGKYFFFSSEYDVKWISAAVLDDYQKL